MYFFKPNLWFKYNFNMYSFYYSFLFHWRRYDSNTPFIIVIIQSTLYRDVHSLDYPNYRHPSIKRFFFLFLLLVDHVHVFLSIFTHPHFSVKLNDIVDVLMSIKRICTPLTQKLRTLFLFFRNKKTKRRIVKSIRCSYKDISTIFR